VTDHLNCLLDADSIQIIACVSIVSNSTLPKKLTYNQTKKQEDMTFCLFFFDEVWHVQALWRRSTFWRVNIYVTTDTYKCFFFGYSCWYSL